MHRMLGGLPNDIARRNSVPTEQMYVIFVTCHACCALLLQEHGVVYEVLCRNACKAGHCQEAIAWQEYMCGV